MDTVTERPTAPVLSIEDGLEVARLRARDGVLVTIPDPELEPYLGTGARLRIVGHRTRAAKGAARQAKTRAVAAARDAGELVIRAADLSVRWQLSWQAEVAAWSIRGAEHATILHRGETVDLASLSLEELQAKLQEIFSQILDVELDEPATATDADIPGSFLIQRLWAAGGAIGSAAILPDRQVLSAEKKSSACSLRSYFARLDGDVMAERAGLGARNSSVAEVIRTLIEAAKTSEMTSSGATQTPPKSSSPPGISGEPSEAPPD